MTKAPEEGKIWEWRAFGQISESLAERIFAYPLRAGLSDLRGEDIYLVSPASDQNVKLREFPTGWFLKFKLLLSTRPGAVELYRESARFTHRFPVGVEHLEEAARLLEVKLPEPLDKSATFDEDALVRLLVKSSPPAIKIKVRKKRSQFQFDGGWLEMADVWFARNRVQSVSVHSTDIEAVRGMLKRLDIGDEMEAMNYIEACRRWG
ncbi:MAG TPA: hypothetical protein VNI02_06295 [Blastocatellia bacterium]|jgi:hypothetical protein|nr:hypothetical protein [Blastocatellia bacterium]